jgi:hypothetical protein
VADLVVITGRPAGPVTRSCKALLKMGLVKHVGGGFPWTAIPLTEGHYVATPRGRRRAKFLFG